MIGQKKTKIFWHQSEARTAPTAGTGPLKPCPQGLLLSYLTFLRPNFSRLFRLFPAPTNCPWVSEDEVTFDVPYLHIVLAKYGDPRFVSRVYSDSLVTADKMSAKLN